MMPVGEGVSGGMWLWAGLCTAGVCTLRGVHTAPYSPVVSKPLSAEPGV